MRRRALIGHTGFIGSNLKEFFEFDYYFNSDNIHQIKGSEFDVIFSAGNSGVKWQVNENPEKDLANINRFIDLIDTVNVDFFILISSIDVYPRPVDVNEDTPIRENSDCSYGRNRLHLETFIRQKFENHLILRIPIIYGNYFRKNVIYDLLYEHEIEKINTNAKLQIYDVARLEKDISICVQHGINVMNLAPEPVWITEVAKEVFGREMTRVSKDELFIYDMKTKYDRFFSGTRGYIQSKVEVIENLKLFTTRTMATNFR